MPASTPAMVLVANRVASAGVGTSAQLLADGWPGLEALVEGVSLVERDPEVRSVGLGGWPNLLGQVELDAGVMDGDTRRTGAVGALRGNVAACRVAHRVLLDLPHELLVGNGAVRFARESGIPQEDPLVDDSRAAWEAHLRAVIPDHERETFPDMPLAPISHAMTDPESVRDTTVFLGRDSGGGLHVATSTSGWAWKYPGRLGDSPIAGAGFYADSRYGAAACTHTGEMTIRAGTARTIVLAMRLGRSLDAAVELAVEELRELDTGTTGGVVIHALDRNGDHRVVALGCDEAIEYWYWRSGFDAPEVRAARMVAR